MSGCRHHYEIIGSFLVQFVGDAHLGTLTRFEYDALVSLQLLEPKGIWARNHGHIMAGTSKLVRECTTDFTGTDDGNRQRRFSCVSYIFHDDFTLDSFSCPRAPSLSRFRASMSHIAILHQLTAPRDAAIQ